MLTSIVFYCASVFSLVNAHGVILAAQGDAGSPPSVGFKVEPSLARNCTNISPCQQDTTIIRDAEITANIVNFCGRTELAGNIDVGEETENALAGGAVTQVTAGSSVTVTIHQVNADGAGPYSCDLDVTGNAGIVANLKNLTVTNNVPGLNGLSQAKTQQFDITVAMPADLACTGASTGNVCTVRCRNAAQAGPFGGCFPVQQTDVTPNVNSPNQLQNAQTLDGVNKQVAQNLKDLPAAIAANQAAGSDEAAQGKAAVDALLGNSITTSAFPAQTPTLEDNAPPVLSGTISNPVANATSVAAGDGTAATSTSAAASATTTAATGRNRGGNGGNGNGNGGNANTGNGNANGNGGNTNGNGGNGNARNGNGNGGARNNNNADNDKRRRSRGSSMRWAKRGTD